MTPAKREEAARVSATFHAAMTALGFRALAESIQLWADVNPSNLDNSSGRWIARALNLVTIRRRHVRELTISYYRLVRALHTGYTLADPFSDEAVPDNTPLGALRNSFYEDVEEYTPEVLQGSQIASQGAYGGNAGDFSEVPNPEDSGGDSELAIVEEILRLAEEIERLEQASGEEARIVLEALGPSNLERKLKVVDKKRSAKEVDAERADAHKNAGYRQAAAVERVVLNGGRGALRVLTEQDKRVIGYVRVSRTGTPCGWCAMLISRGPVYRTEKTAGGGLDAEGDMYHDNCHCYAEPVFSREQFDKDPRFNLNREYAELWPKVTGGYRGNEALSVWRRYFRANQD